MKYVLKACPFCGAGMMFSDKSEPGPVLCEFGVVPDPHITCHGCGARTRDFKTRKEAVAFWNSRPRQPARAVTTVSP